ncbi:amidohydrolase family protein [Haliea sp. E17]|uniref:amidohydrolase family protein n=1 Tax=Haliea sp. E17 TaxID=3401576 RepID=UPI003AAEBCCF
MKNLKITALVLVLALGAHAHGEPADLIVYGDYLLSMEPGANVLQDGAVAIRGNTIVAAGPRQQVDAQYQASRTIPGAGRVILPGLVNGHTHTSMTLFRGMVDDLDLMTWLQDYVFPMEARFVTPEFVRTGSTLACWEMIRGGTTTFVDMYFYPDQIAEVVQRCGLRAVIGAPHIDFPSPGFKGWDDSFAAAQDFVARWQGRDPRITPAFAPHAPYTVSPEHLAATVVAAQKAHAPITMHLAEAPAESDYVREHFDTTPVKHVAGLGMLDTPLIAAHMVQLDADDIALVAKGSVGPIHNPTSNMKLGAGISPVPAMLAAGINVGLGTDGAASNNDLDLWEEIRMAALLHKVAAGDPTVLPAPEALAMATRLGAAAIGLGNQVGQLKPGMQADLIQVDLGKVRHQPRYDIVSHLVYVLDSTDVVTTIVAGQVLMEDARILSLDEAQLRADVEASAAKIRAALAATEAS